MATSGSIGIKIGDGLVSGPSAAAARIEAPAVPMRMKVPVALSPDDLLELTAALASYIERQSLSASLG